MGMKSLYNSILQAAICCKIPYLWVKGTLLDTDQSATLENKGLVQKNSSSWYMSDIGDEMVKYHVYACREFQEKMN